MRRGFHRANEGDRIMHRAVRSGFPSRFTSVLALVVAFAASDARAGDPPVFGYGVMFDNATSEYAFVTFPLVMPVAPLDGQIVAATAVGSNYASLYAIDANASLLTVDTATGSASLVGPLGIQPGQRVSLAANPGTGALFAVIGDSSCLLTSIYSVDPATGLATLIAPVTECVAAVAADAANQLLYFLDSGASALNVVDADGNETTLGDLGIVLNPSARIMIDPVSGGLFMTLFEFPSFANSLYSIDTTTGAATFVMSIGGANPLGAPVLAPPAGTVIDRIFVDGFDP
jgi:hypothetical protein